MKLLTVAILLIIPFFLTGCTAKVTDNASKTVTSTNSQKMDPGKFIFTTVKDAVSKNVGLKCEYTDEQNERIDTFIKGQQIYMESSQKAKEEGKTVLLKGVMTGTKYYVWQKVKRMVY
jgi:hypothetical protein